MKTFSKYFLTLMMVAVLVILAACTPKTTASTKSASTIGTPPPEVTQYAKDWPLPGKDYNNTRATTDSTINSSNVSTLGASCLMSPAERALLVLYLQLP